MPRTLAGSPRAPAAGPSMGVDAGGFPVTRSRAGVVRSAAGARDLAALDARVSGCRACPRLVAWREEVARGVKRASFRDQDYWGRPVPGLGPADARIAVVGLAPGRARRQPHRPGVHRRPQRRLDLRRAAGGPGLANQPTSTARRRRAGAHRRPGRRGGALRAAGQRADARRSGTPARPGWRASWRCCRGCACIVVLGGFGWTALWPVLAAAGYRLPRPRPAFGHGVEVDARAARAGR